MALLRAAKITYNCCPLKFRDESAVIIYSRLAKSQMAATCLQVDEYWSTGVSHALTTSFTRNKLNQLPLCKNIYIFIGKRKTFTHYERLLPGGSLAERGARAAMIVRRSLWASTIYIYLYIYAFAKRHVWLFAGARSSETIQLFAVSIEIKWRNAWIHQHNACAFLESNMENGEGTLPAFPRCG